jgi:hypothetical protein
LARFQAPSWWLQLIAGGQDRHGGPWVDGYLGDPKGRQQSNFLRPKPCSSFKDTGSLTEILSPSADVLPRCWPAPDDELTMLLNRVLLHGNGIGSLRNLSAGQDAHGLTLSHKSAKRPSRLRRANNV